MTYEFDYMQTPVGEMKLVASSKGLCGVLWPNDDPELVNFGETSLNTKNEIIEKTKIQLSEYFSKQRTQFDLPLDFIGTEFQKKVWSKLQNISYGQTKAYKDIAIELENPNASRAVGSANRKNPICIVVPCHRVIGANGNLTGYIGGLNAKEWLLNFERKS